MSLLKVIKTILIYSTIIVTIICISQILLIDRFIVRGPSMEPTLKDGTKIFVNKTLLGGRIYKNLNFETGELQSFRALGIRKCRVGDIIVFNDPFVISDKKISFSINTVCVKRVVACPGDTVMIKEGHIINTSEVNTKIPIHSEVKLKNTSDRLLLDNDCLSAGQFANKDKGWTIKDFGPYVVPYKGMIVDLDSDEYNIYSTLIEYETNSVPSFMSRYSFKEDYYFVVGDNVSDSYDSRYYGPIPEAYIVGIVYQKEKEYK